MASAVGLLAALVWIGPETPAATASFGSFATGLVAATRFLPELGHNVSDIRGTLASGAPYDSKFLSHFDRTGATERWGYPISEVFEETDGVLTQYFQRGVLDFRPGPGVQRRLAWDYIGDGLGGSPDMGVEPGTSNPNDGLVLGPWGHRVSNTSVEGAPVGFLDVFVRLRGVESFGLPKTEARADTGLPGTVMAPGATPGFIRQYFQAAVLEFHPGDPSPVKLRLLGDALRDRRYPNQRWQNYVAFQRAASHAVGQSVSFDLLQRAPPTERTVEAAVDFVRPSVVRIETDEGCASGFFVDDSGHLATNWRVVEDADRVVVRLHTGATMRARILSGDATSDLALLHVDDYLSTPIE